MGTTTTSSTGDTFDRSLAHGHSLDLIAGYRVTEVTGNGIDVPIRFFDGASSAAAATEEAQSIRTDPARGWARIDTYYRCGCWSNR